MSNALLRRGHGDMETDRHTEKGQCEETQGGCLVRVECPGDGVHLQYQTCLRLSADDRGWERDLERTFSPGVGRSRPRERSHARFLPQDREGKPLCHFQLPGFTGSSSFSPQSLDLFLCLHSSLKISLVLWCKEHLETDNADSHASRSDFTPKQDLDQTSCLFDTLAWRIFCFCFLYSRLEFL